MAIQLAKDMSELKETGGMLAADGILANRSNAASADNDVLVQSNFFEGMAGCISGNTSDLPVKSRKLLAAPQSLDVNDMQQYENTIVIDDNDDRGGKMPVCTSMNSVVRCSESL